MYPNANITEHEALKALAFLIMNVQNAKEQYIIEERFERAVEAQEEIKTLKERVFQILLSPHYELHTDASENIVFRKRRAST